MNSILFHFLGGDAFFTGFLVIAAGAFVTAISHGRRHRRGSTMIIVGWIIVLASGNAISSPNWAITGVLSLVALTARPRSSTPDSDASEDKTKLSINQQPVRVRLCVVLGTVALGAIPHELVVHHRTHIRIPTQRPVFVIGDSLSAGINDGVDIPWPARLDGLSSPKVTNLAKAGATCRSAMKQVEGLSRQCVVIVEIGGNDLLSGRSADEFRADLDKLLAAIKAPNRQVTVVMFELPLPPFFHSYGSVQRELADKHNVGLIPRRLMASVLFSKDATLDSLHLSNDGHRQLANRVADFLGLNNAQ